MPSASEELRSEYIATFDTLDEGPGMDYLEGRGFTIVSGHICPPKNLAPDPIADICICFLCDEWDFEYSTDADLIESREELKRVWKQNADLRNENANLSERIQELETRLASLLRECP